MQHKPYHFITQWQFNAPLERVFQEIYQSEAWPSWWKGVRSVVDIKTGNPDGIGDVKRYTWRSILPYTLTFDMTLVEKIPLSRLAGNASGELEGRGIWQFNEENGVTYVRYEWSVRTTKAWMKFLTPIARPFFAWNHDVVMDWGRKGLERRLAE